VSTNPAKRRNVGRLPRGICTQESAYQEPILRALIELGGSANKDDVLDHVKILMKDVLKDIDYERHAISPRIRWREKAEWQRKKMVKDGLLKSTSQRGIWEITEAGRLALTKELANQEI
jgi:Mrr N-terminal domain